MFMKMNNMINNFSVVIPVFNEEEIFLESANKIYNICQEMNMPFEIIFSAFLSNPKNLIIFFFHFEFLSILDEIERQQLLNFRDGCPL